jgi:DNA polymerase
LAKIITLDFETYYDKDYTLTKLTTQEYIRNPLFQIIGVAVSVNGSQPRWHSANSVLDVAAFLSAYGIEEKGTILVAHNAMFDGAILEWVLNIKPWRYFCTMMGSRPFVVPYTGSMSLKEVSKHLELGMKGTEVQKVQGMRLEDFDGAALLRYASYCCQDVHLTTKLFAKLYPSFPKDEIDIIDLTIKKFTRPKLVLNRPVISLALQAERKEKAKLLKEADVDDVSELMSNLQFADALKRLGVEPPMKISPTTGKPTHAFAKSDHNFVALKDHVNPRVRALVEARLAHKSTINETRLDRFEKVAACTKEGKLAVPILYYGAHPGRFSGFDKLNLQNLGRKSPLRRAIIAPHGHKIIAGDLSQIEARITACLAGQWDLNLVTQYTLGRLLKQMKKKGSSPRPAYSPWVIRAELRSSMKVCVALALRTLRAQTQKMWLRRTVAFTSRSSPNGTLWNTSSSAWYQDSHTSTDQSK